MVVICVAGLGRELEVSDLKKNECLVWEFILTICFGYCFFWV